MGCTNRITPHMLPCTIKLTRIAPRFLDFDDNLPMALKHIKDYVCDLLIPGKQMGRADNDMRLRFAYDQIKGIPHEYAIQIEIIPLESSIEFPNNF